MKTFLFDLDGTLLPMNLNKFMELYIGALTEKFQPYLEPQLLKERLRAGTMSMIHNKGRKKTNEKAFMDCFMDQNPLDAEKVVELFESFYDNEFMQVQESTWQDPQMIRAIKILRDNGFRMAIATNPLFPQKAVYQRIYWAGLQPEDFELITSFEIMHAAKPNPEFYEEVIERLGVLPGETLMVGNDAVEDLAAGQLGISTYLIEDHLLNSQKQKIKPDMQGSSRDFLHYVKSL